jgi:hypothetical protein
MRRVGNQERCTIFRCLVLVIFMLICRLAFERCFLVKNNNSVTFLKYHLKLVSKNILVSCAVLRLGVFQ